MNKTNLKIALFIAGTLCLLTAGLLLLKPLSPDSFKTKSVFELGILTDQVGEVEILRDRKALPSKSGIKIYSGDVVILKNQAEASINIGDERLSIIGPASFEIAFPKKDSREVFLNFSTFTKTELIDEKPEHITSIYRNWSVEPGFGSETIMEENYQALGLPKDTGTDTKKQKESSTINANQSQESSLEEAIAVKRPLLKRCYENYLKKNPQATGELTVEFTVQTSGKVSASRIAKSSFINDTLFKTCIQDVFRKVKAQSFSGEPLLVSYPIAFE